jgi:hypothetical protein
VVGAASVVAGGLAVFETENGAGSAALLAIGALLFVVGVVGELLANLGFGGATVQWQNELDVAAARADEQGADQAADSVRAVLEETTAPIASSYEGIRSGVSPGPTRTTAMEALMTAAREAARASKFKKQDVVDKFMTGNEGDRIFALAVMQEDPALRDFETAWKAIASSHSAFEQYHGLLLATRLLDDGLDQQQQKELASAIQRQRGPGGYIIRGTDRWALSEQILARIK